jgi:hypothetical protein
MYVEQIFQDISKHMLETTYILRLGQLLKITQDLKTYMWQKLNLEKPNIIIMKISKPSVTTLTLGSQPKQRHEKVQVEGATRESHLHSQKCEGMNPHTPKWTPTLGVKIPMESQLFIEVF